MNWRPDEPEENAITNSAEQNTTAWERIRNTLWFFTKRPAILLAPRHTRIPQRSTNRAHLAYSTLTKRNRFVLERSRNVLLLTTWRCRC